jgi:parallel beta-helix repeat protein
MNQKRTWIVAFVFVLLLTSLTLVYAAVAATVIVNSTTDISDGDTSSITALLANPGSDGLISLREGIEAANNTTGGGAIEFDIPTSDPGYDIGSEVWTIAVNSALPALTGGSVHIDGYSQPGAQKATATYLATLKIVLDGSSAGTGNGLEISNSANNTIEGLVINQFPSDGIYIHGSGALENTIRGNYIGTDESGTLERGNGHDGVFIYSAAHTNTIGGSTDEERNVISGNAWFGIWIADSSGNIVSGNYIGTDSSGSTALGNTYHGVFIDYGANNNIGGSTDGERNVISGNGWDGVSLDGSSTSGNTVSGNYIGTNASGTSALGNSHSGVYLVYGAHDNTIGGSTSGAGNLISGNGSDGVQVGGSSTTGNTITQNSIFSNGGGGINLVSGANGDIPAPVIETTSPGSINIIGTACISCTVEVFVNSDTDGEGESYIGTTTADASGNFTITVDTLSHPYLTATATDVISGTSEFSGVYTFIATVTVDSTTDVSDGDTTDIPALIANRGADGVISLREAIQAANNTTGGGTIEFNIPTDDSGYSSEVWTIGVSSALPALTGGSVHIDGYSQPGALQATVTELAILKIVIDGTSAGFASGFVITSTGNRISGLVINQFSKHGIDIYSSIASGNFVTGNHIGTDSNGTSALGNTWDGIIIDLGAHNNTIGGSTVAERNVISGNGWNGVEIYESGTNDNSILGNYIGIDATGGSSLGNSIDGVFIGYGAQNNIIGGSTGGERNIISGNNLNGVELRGSSINNNTISGNYIGTDVSGTSPLSNAYYGVSISDGAENNTIGGSTEGERNVISGNGWDGVRLSDSETGGNTISGNYIGTDSNGTSALGNTLSGIHIRGGAFSNTIGGSKGGAGNLISGNGTDGVYVEGSSTISNTITQNSIFSNGGDGIDLVDGANGDIPAPVIQATTTGSINIIGTACVFCTVEVFTNSDTDGEGETYIGTTTADASGNFTLTVDTLESQYLTATATDARGTSEFSLVFDASTRFYIYLPLVLME